MMAAHATIWVTVRLRRRWAVRFGCWLTYHLGPVLGWRVAYSVGDLWCRLAVFEYSTNEGRTWRRHSRPWLTFNAD